MKKQTFLYSLICVVLSSHGQKQFIHTASKENISCNYDCTILDIAELNNNPDAIIWVSPILEKGLNLNPHPVGVYYFGKKWNIFNLDQKPIPADSKFNVEYVTSPDKTHFQYTITTENLQKDGSAIIDYRALNNNPTAQFNLFISWNPETQRATTNRNPINIQYNKDAGKWSIRNINNNPLFARVVYNIVISFAGNANTIPVIPNAVITNSAVISSTINSASNGVTAMYMTAWADGKQLPGPGISGSNPLGKTEIIDFIMAANSPYDAATGMRTGKKIFELITIKTVTGFPPTIPLFNAFANNQNMVFTIETFTLNKSTGSEELNYTIKLTGAHIISFKQTNDKESILKNKYLDEIKISFGQIEYSKDGVSVFGKE